MNKKNYVTPYRIMKFDFYHWMRFPTTIWSSCSLKQLRWS